MSKFDKIFEAREQDTAIESEKAENKSISENNNRHGKNSVRTTTATVNQPARRGRPTAKRSDPDYVGFTTYIRRDTHTKVKIALLQEGKNRELSELVEDLLFDWTDKK